MYSVDASLQKTLFDSIGLTLGHIPDFTEGNRSHSGKLMWRYLENTFFLLTPLISRCGKYPNGAVPEKTGAKIANTWGGISGPFSKASMIDPRKV